MRKKNSKETNKLLKRKKQVYLPMAADLIHNGHINIIKKANELGEVTIGLLTDNAISKYKRVPFLTFEQRKIVAENIVGVKKVIKQESDDFEYIVRKLKPDFFVHGDDWKKGPQSKERKILIQTMKKWNGIVLEFKYTKNVSSTKIKKNLKKI